MPAPYARLLLPPRSRFAGEALPHAVARALGRAGRTEGDASVQALFDVLPRGWPAAAVTREVDAGDAADALWLRADPAYVRPDINGARLLAVGEMLRLDAESAEALLRPLRPLFGDAGLPIDAGRPSAWYSRLPIDSPLPVFASPDDALGADMFDHMPAGPDGRRWRALLSEAQVLLHQHPLNAARQAQGLVPVNSLWFWGAGRLPDRVSTRFARIDSFDPTVHAFARVSSATAVEPGAWTTPEVDVALDLRHERNLERLCRDALAPAIADALAGRIAYADLRFADGACFLIRRSQALRFWKRPLRVLAEAEAA